MRQRATIEGVPLILTGPMQLRVCGRWPLPLGKHPPVFLQGCTYVEVRRHRGQTQTFYTASVLCWDGSKVFADPAWQGLGSTARIAIEGLVHGYSLAEEEVPPAPEEYMAADLVGC